ncbi:ACT domain-containing protein [Mesorhizobium sp. CCANP35]|uniref:ACT domain-containing protein n=1 Tax=Mesorhizobium neociceri TaxID=1307853 RepID=A0A838BAY6_9HYPH|nr:ACT domain-containing protein [Mesorhizobium neociceri]
MNGETDLKKLLATMSPDLLPDIYVFATLTPGTTQPEGLDPVMVFREREGLTLIVTEDAARVAGLTASFRCRMITLNIHSSLEAVGFLAAITTRLAAAGMGVNPVSAFYHDHLFVPADRAEEAMELLRELARQSFATKDLQRDDVEAIASGRMSSESDHLDALLDPE